jgi:hypothetical protein
MIEPVPGHLGLPQRVAERKNPAQPFFVRIQAQHPLAFASNT